MKIGIIGGGITGLSAAYYLAGRGESVTVFERDGSPAGVAGSFPIEGAPLEKFFHNISCADLYVLELIHELNLEGDLLWKAANFGFYCFNRTYPFNSPLDVLRFKPLSLWERFKMGLGVLKMKRLKDWRGLDSLSAEEFIRKNMGEKAYEMIWGPLLRSRFGPEWERQISASWLWAKVNTTVKAQSRNFQDAIGYLNGGFGKMFNRLEESILLKGGEIRRGVSVQQIDIQQNQVKGLKTSSGYETLDGVIVTVAIPIFLNLVSQLKESERRNLEQFKYLGIVCLVLILKNSLSQMYWLNVSNPEFPFVGVIEHTHLDSSRTLHGQHVVYIPKYTDPSSGYYRATKEELLELYLPYLKRIFPSFDRNWITEAYLWREKYAQPITTVGYAQRIPPFETPVQNLYLATMAQIYPEDRGLNNGVRMAKELVDVICRSRPRGVDESPSLVEQKIRR